MSSVLPHPVGLGPHGGNDLTGNFGGPWVLDRADGDADAAAVLLAELLQLLEDGTVARAEALWAQSPPVGIWYIRAGLLAQALKDGFDWIAYLHARGTQVAAWTLNPGRPSDVELACQLATAGVDRITTDDAPALARALAECPQGNINAGH